MFWNKGGKMHNIKYYLDITIPYWFNKQMQFTLYKIIFTTGYRIQLTIWKLHRLVGIDGYENEFGTNWWKHFIIYSKYKKEKDLTLDEIFKEWDS